HRERRRLLLRSAGRLWSPADATLEGNARGLYHRVPLALRTVRRAHGQAPERARRSRCADLSGAGRRGHRLREAIVDAVIARERSAARAAWLQNAPRVDGHRDGLDGAKPLHDEEEERRVAESR